MANAYLKRREARLAFEALKRRIVFGMAISTLLLAIGAWRYYLVIGANDRLWAGTALLGALGYAAALLFPALWNRPEQALSALMRKLGETLFAGLLVLVYGLMFVPVGWLLRRIRGEDPIYAWEGQVPDAMEGWRDKEALFETNVGRPGRPNLVRRLVGILRFFVSRGHLVFLPALIILIALGMVLFFVQSSALAPFIYTLF